VNPRYGAPKLHISAQNVHRAKNLAIFGQFGRECAMGLDTLDANVHIRARNVQICDDRSFKVAHSRTKRPDIRI